MIPPQTRKRAFAFLHDLLMIPFAWSGAYIFRFDLSELAPHFIDKAISVFPVIFITQGIVFLYFGLYRGLWRFASIPDLVRIIKSIVVGVVAAAVIIFFFYRMEHLPRTIFPLYGIFLVILLGGPRLFYRWIKDQTIREIQGKKVIIYGAGKAGEALARDLLRATPNNTKNRRMEDLAYTPVAFIDDDINKHGSEIHGLRVIGGRMYIRGAVADYDADLILIALPNSTSAEMREIVELCERSDIEFRTLPSVNELYSARAEAASASSLREVLIEDLLGRDPVNLEWNKINEDLTGKRILITGAGGSIGSELCRQIAKLGPSTLILLERNEFNLYTIEYELRKINPELIIKYCLMDISSQSSIEHAMSMHRPDIVFHAAAYKHVPILQTQLIEVVQNNIIGTKIVASAADKYGCQTFILVSTDKAVNPTNFMGASKRVAEIYCQNLDRKSETNFITVRFGNVLGSAGSVVPLFKKQISEGGPVTVTHPEMTRYFMTIPESCQLIMQAAAIGKGGEIFVLDMGDAVKINYLAEQMIRLSGKEPYTDIDIVYTGIRPGEKLYEELFHRAENLKKTQHEKISLASYRDVDWEKLVTVIKEMEKAAEVYDEAAVKSCLNELVPEMEESSSHGEKIIPR